MDRKIKLYCSTVAEDMAVCICASYAAASFGADTFLGTELTRIVRIASMTVMALCWFSMAFFNGIRMRKVFAAGMTVFLVLPSLLELLFSRVRALKFSEAGLVIRPMCRFIGRLPFAEVEDITGINGMICPAAMALLCLLLYGAGSFYTRSAIILASDDGGDTRKD